mgnify:CR=1 FL=1
MTRHLASLVLLAAFAARAEAPPAGGASLSLDEAVSLAIRDNVEIQSLRAKAQAMQERPAQAGALENPMLTFRGMDMAEDGDFPDANEKQFAVEQAIPGFGKRGWRRRAAEQEAAAMGYEVEAMVLDVVLEVKEAYHGLWSARQARGILRDEADVLARLETVARTAYAAGQSEQPDVLKAQAESTMLKARLFELEAQIRTLEARLNILTGRAADEPLEIAPPPALPEMEADAEILRARAGGSRPEIGRAAAALERARIERRLMGRESVPDYRLGVEYRTFRDDEPDMAMFMVGIDLPIWRGRTRAGIREADRMIASRQAALEASKLRADLDVRQAHFNAKASRETLSLYRDTLIPQARSGFEAGEAGYRAGKVDFMDLLESERFLLEARILAAMAEGEAGMQAARLERALGSAEEREGDAGRNEQGKWP